MKVRLPLVALAVVAVAAAAGAASSGTTGWSAKVVPGVLADAAAGETEFFVELAEQADVSGAYKLRTKEEKGRFVYERLTATARATQAPLRSRLERLGVRYKPYWIVNAIWVRGDLRAVEAIASRPDVARVFANTGGRLVEPMRPPRTATSADRAKRPDAPEPGLTQVGAPQVWAMGYTGQGVVVASADTGVRWDHNALKGKYRGWDGVTASHDYNWRDAISSGGGSCGPSTVAPCDDNNHGSHTTGTMVGDDGLGNQIGMAPGAKWIGCRNMNVGNGTPATYLNCMEWLLAPTKIDGTLPDPTKAPHVVNNSWSCTPEEGCNVPQPTLKTQLANSRAAGIVYVVSAGNSGPSCDTVNNPLGIYANSFTVGATDSDTDLITEFSSRGPSSGPANDEGPNLKPNISAPGAGVRSSTRATTSSYSSLSGTSMAAPHVAGLVALIISAKPSLAGNVDAIENIIEQSAVRKTPPLPLCGTPPELPTSVPNNTYGWGRIDALAAVQRALGTTGVAVRSLAVTVTRRGVTVRWRTAPAQAARALGFHVWRGPAAAGRYTRLTKTLIPARPTTAYQYLDRTARRARTYFYKLQLVGADGRKTWFGPLRARL